MLCSIFIVVFVCVHAAFYDAINDNNNYHHSSNTNALHDQISVR